MTRAEMNWKIFRSVLPLVALVAFVYYTQSLKPDYKTKEPYLIFCYGMSEEVKNVIIQNNSNGATQIIPISMQMSEDNVNIMNDFAVVHAADVISSTKGQSISQETRKDLPYGKHAIITKNTIKLNPL